MTKHTTREVRLERAILDWCRKNHGKSGYARFCMRELPDKTVAVIDFSTNDKSGNVYAPTWGELARKIGIDPLQFETETEE